MATARLPISAVQCRQLHDQLPIHLLTADPRPPLTFTSDGPGTLSSTGPRHDNDHEDFRKIWILPTVDEVLAIDCPVYMPHKDQFVRHFLPNGPARHLDTTFRQLRCDSTEILRDVCHSAAQVSFLENGTLPKDHVRQETVAGSRYFLYRNIKVEELLSHEHKSMLVRVSYDCPPFMRGQKLQESGRFKNGMLVALLELDHTTMELNIHYFEVELAQSTFSMDSYDGRGARAAVRLSFLPTATSDDIMPLARHALGLKKDCELYLVEFPKVLFAGFYNCLKCIQNMKETDFAFPQYIAPDTNTEVALLAQQMNISTAERPWFKCSAPEYTQRPNFRYKLSAIVPSSSPIASVSVEEFSKPRTIERLKRETTLDDGQAVSLRDSLVRDIACTQGPPGCGKTFLGVKLAQVLVDSRPSEKPILVVCLTNHALDSFLIGLRDAGVSNMLRIGSGSKDNWTNAINIRDLRKKTRYSKVDAQDLHNRVLRKKEINAELESLCKAISSQVHTGNLPWQYVVNILRDRYPDIYAQFTTKAKIPLAQSFTFEYWSSGGDLQNLRDLHVELANRLAQLTSDQNKPHKEDVATLLSDLSWEAQLHDFRAGASSVWNMSLPQRQALIRTWERQVDKEDFAKKATALHADAQAQEVEIKRLQDNRDIRIMSSQNVIAMTTTAVAARWDILRSLNLEILICEEAAEVMEAHTLCSLLPTLQQAILIGDPQQLRPETNEQSLSLESGQGEQYRLDESLLERLMFPQDPSAHRIPASHPNIQRRMHPEIADITRLTYPYLKDHESTFDREPTYGIAQRLFWWDHRVPELESDDLKSHANLHEVEMVSALVEYLLRTGAYTQGEIAVLTPYAGQLVKLYEKLTVTCDIWLSNKDRDALVEEEVLALGEEGRAKKDEVAMSDMLRLATVDNFQGEEASVIILSTVRSGGKPGFLKSLNRINVACSRARNGFYIVGNSQTLTQVPMWRQIIQIFNGKIGASIKAQCHTHPEHGQSIQHPEDFRKVAECEAICGEKLDCGHECVHHCHPPDLHARLVCQEPCSKTFDCGHQCTKQCFQTCGTCELSVDDTTLPCGHQGKLLCSGDISKCTVVIATRILRCGHTASIFCGMDPHANLVCQQPCGSWLPCQHTCTGTCGQCNKDNGTTHVPCSIICGLTKPCGHNCKESCHTGKPCPKRCLEPCADECEHGACENKCQNACDPCVKPAHPGCDHEASDTICCLPSLSLPCCRECPKTLDCGHVCPSLCGEMCPPSELCPECVTGKRGPALLYASSCQHLTEVAQLDAVNLHGVYEVDSSRKICSLNSNLALQDVHMPKCLCGVPLPSTRRYKIHTKLLCFQQVLDLLLAKMGRKLASFSNAVDILDKELQTSLTSFMEDIRPNPLASKANFTLVLRRSREPLELQKAIANYRTDVISRICRGIDELGAALPNIVAKYTLMFGIRFEVLQNRLAIVRLLDASKLATKFRSLQDPSFGTQRQGSKLIEFVHKESAALIEHCSTTLSHPLVTTSPAVEAQVRLQQFEFLLFARTTRLQLADDQPSAEDIPLYMDSEAISTSMDAVAKLISRSPDVCTPFRQTLKEFARLLETNETLSLEAIPAIKNVHVLQTEKQWARHEIGHIKLCEKRHVYSARTFPDACPECGKRAPSVNAALIRHSAKHLFEENFLQAMRSASNGSQKSPTAAVSSPELNRDTAKSAIAEKENVASIPVVQLTMEQRFIAAMRKSISVKVDKQSSSDDTLDTKNEHDMELGNDKPATEVDVPEAQLNMEEKFLAAMNRMKVERTM